MHVRNKTSPSPYDPVQMANVTSGTFQIIAGGHIWSGSRPAMATVYLRLSKYSYSTSNRSPILLADSTLNRPYENNYASGVPTYDPNTTIPDDTTYAATNAVYLW